MGKRVPLAAVSFVKENLVSQVSVRPETYSLVNLLAFEFLHDFESLASDSAADLED